MRYNSSAYIGHIRNILNFQKNIGVEMQGSSGTRRSISRHSFHPRSIVLPIIVLLTIAVLAVGDSPPLHEFALGRGRPLADQWCTSCRALHKCQSGFDHLWA